MKLLSYLKTIAARLAGRGFDWLPPLPPDEPPAGVRQPRKHGPGGRNAAVALDEPPEPTFVRAEARKG
jgi:hypothetical protein